MNHAFLTPQMHFSGLRGLTLYSFSGKHGHMLDLKNLSFSQTQLYVTIRDEHTLP